MDSGDEEMLAALLDEEADFAAAATDEEHLLMLACLAGLYDVDAQSKRGGSAPGRRKSKARQRAEGYCILYGDYFADDPVDGEKTFRRRFRMNRNLFLRIVHGVREFDNYFVCKKDCTGTVGFSSLQKCTVDAPITGSAEP